MDARWQYWWGCAYDGWSENERISVNQPSYSGDHILAWILCRPIDMMAVLSALDHVQELDRKVVLDSSVALLYSGGVFPFAAGSLVRHGRYPLYAPKIAFRFSRSSPPSDIASSVWAIGRGSSKH